MFRVLTGLTSRLTHLLNMVNSDDLPEPRSFWTYGGRRFHGPETQRTVSWASGGRPMRKLDTAGRCRLWSLVRPFGRQRPVQPDWRLVSHSHTSKITLFSCRSGSVVDLDNFLISQNDLNGPLAARLRGGGMLHFKTPPPHACWRFAELSTTAEKGRKPGGHHTHAGTLVKPKGASS